MFSGIDHHLRALIAIFFSLGRKLAIFAVIFAVLMLLTMHFGWQTRLIDNVSMAFLPFANTAVHVSAFAFFTLMLTFGLHNAGINLRRAGQLGLAFALLLAALLEGVYPWLLGESVAVHDVLANGAGILIAWIAIEYFQYITFVGRWENDSAL